jgi:hypothetical protein
LPAVLVKMGNFYKINNIPGSIQRSKEECKM